MGGLLDGLPTGLLGGGTLATLVSLAVWFIYTGRLVPGKYLDQMRVQMEKWQAVAEARAEENRVQARQLDKLLEQGQTLEKVLGSIQAAVQERDRDREHNERERGRERPTRGGQR